MNWFTLWLMWLGKMSSVWEVTLQWQIGVLEQSKRFPSTAEASPAPPSPEAEACRDAVTSEPEALVERLPQEPAKPPEMTSPHVSPRAEEAEEIAPPPPEVSPPEETASPSQEVSPPEEMALPPQEVLPPEEIEPPPQAIAPPPQETSPPEEIALPPPETSPPEEISLSPQEPSPPEEIAPPPQEFSPPEEIALPLQEMAQVTQDAPKQEEPAPSSVELIPSPQEVAPASPEIAMTPEIAPDHQQEAPPPPASAPSYPEETPSASDSVPVQQEEAPPPPQESAPTPQEVPPPVQEVASDQPEAPPPSQESAPILQEVASKERPMSAREGTEGSMTWRKRPMIYEIPTWVWLDEMRVKYGSGTTLGTIPAAEWDALAALDVDAVWLMGVWERSPAGIAVSNANAEQQDEFRRLLPDYTPADNVGSAYCVRDYVVAEHLGGPEALAQARAALNARGLRLILDFVPNHVAIDHPWAALHPDYFIRGTTEDLARAPAEFVEVKGQVLANGRDPYFAPWRDVLQLNAYHTQLRAAVIETVTSIAAQCDGMRCDMAMLLLNDIFRRTWGDRAGERPATEYWQDVIPAVKAKYPNTLFIAEVYWDLEYEMMQKGFDYCYDKRLYDRLVSDNAESIRAHLTAGLDYQDRLLRFIENHDEPRAAATFYSAKERAAAVVMATTPGAKLVYDGQIEGRQVKLPVFLARRRPETPNSELETFYRSLLTAIHADMFHDGEWTLCDRSGWPDNSSFHDIIAWTWRYHDHRTLIVVNLSTHRSQAMVHLPWDDLRGQTWRLVETLAWECYVRDGGDLANSGLFVDLDAWGFHFLKFE